MTKGRAPLSLCLMAGAPVTVADEYSTIGEHLWVYQNREMLALNSDGFVGKPLTADPADESSQTWKGRMSDGDWIVGFFNRENNVRNRSIDFGSLGLTRDASVRDLWQHQDLGLMKSYSAWVPHHGCVIVRISKTSTNFKRSPTIKRPLFFPILFALRHFPHSQLY